jgi:uncharacterized glyoxalase superfamily protein PhnB
MEHPTVFPALRYADGRAAIDFLCGAFGAERHAVYGDGETIHHAELRFGNGIVMLGSSSGEQPTGGSVYVAVEDPDGHCARAREAGAEIVRPPEDTPYGSREYTAKDPEGNAWSFGTYQPFEYDHAAEQAGAEAAG